MSRVTTINVDGYLARFYVETAHGSNLEFVLGAANDPGGCAVRAAGALGQCEALRAFDYYSDAPTTDRRCSLSARFEVDGKRLCSKRAGVAALKILLDEDKPK